MEELQRLAPPSPFIQLALCFSYSDTCEDIEKEQGWVRHHDICTLHLLRVLLYPHISC